MIFTSFDFLVFLAVVFPLHWLVFSRSRQSQNLFLLLASWVFYGYFDVRFLLLLIATTTADFYFAGRVFRSDGVRKRAWLAASIISNFTVLGIFKYYNFFIESLPFKMPVLTVLLPLGISFYTFQAVSYTIDVYREDLAPADNLLDFLVFVAFFPHMVAGPIMRAADLMTQFQRKRSLTPAAVSLGIRWVLWGYFKKLVVADNCGFLVDRVFADTSLEGLVLWLGLVLFSFQIYADFSGYSDIAVGLGKLFGVELILNFRYPYLARGMGDFWRRWHVSLSTWFRDYVYVPLGGNRVHRKRNVVLTFLASGLWHGANWTFLCWGLFHSLAALVWSRPPTGPIKWRDLPVIGATFTLVTILWVFFRASSMADALDYLARCARPDLPSAALWDGEILSCALVGISILVVVEWICRDHDHPTQLLSSLGTVPRHMAYGALLCLTYLLGNLQAGYDFIYFQF